MDDALRSACARAVHVRSADGRILHSGRACLLILSAIGFPTTAKLFSLPPLIWFVELLYLLVARNRSLFARFFFRQERPLPTQESADESR